jgi:hypothetical protein
LRTDRQITVRQTDVTKLIIALREFGNTPKDICKNRQAISSYYYPCRPTRMQAKDFLGGTCVSTLYKLLHVLALNYN